MGGRERVGGSTMPSDIGDQVVCTVGQTDGHSNPYHTMMRADVEWNSLGPHSNLLMPSSGPTGSVMHGSAWLDRVGKKPSVKADLFIYSNCVTVSGQCLSVAIIISNKMDFNSCAYMVDFPKSSHIYRVTDCYAVYWQSFSWWSNVYLGMVCKLGKFGHIYRIKGCIFFHLFYHKSKKTTYIVTVL